MPSSSSFVRRLLAVGLALLGLALSAAAQLEMPREFPTEASFRSTIRAMRAGAEDGFTALRGERRDEDTWIPVLMEGLSEDRPRVPGDARHRLTALEALQKYFLNYAFQRVHAPDAGVQAAMEADFLALRGWMMDEAGDWDFHATTGDDHKRFFRLERPDGEALINLVFEARPRGWWSLGIVGVAPWVEPPPMPADEAVASAAEDPGTPTEAGFGAVVEAMRAGAYDGLEPLKGLVAPRHVSERHGGMPTWTVMPMEGLAPDPEGDLHAMADYGRIGRDNGTVSAHYKLATVERPNEAQRVALEEDFRRLRGWLAAHSGGWGTDESFYAWSYMTAESRCFKLVPLPGRPVRRVDGEHVPRIELLLRKRTIDEGEPGESWSLELNCDAQGHARPGPGEAPWALDLLAKSDPPQALPAIPEDFEEVVLALIADAPNDFASQREAEPRPDYEWAGHVDSLADPLFPMTQPRHALDVHLMDAPDPDALRDYVALVDDGWRSEAHAALGILSVAAPNALTRRAVDLRMEELAARLMERLDGWRLRVVDVPGGKEDFNERVTTLDGLRPDGHPVWVQLGRASYPKDIPGYPSGDVLQLTLYVSTNHAATVGEDLPGRWRAALERGDEPLASGVRVLGDPLAGRLFEGDRVVAPAGLPVDLLALLGANGEDEVRLDVVRDGRYEEVVVTPPRLSLARWKELCAATGEDELGAAALSLLGARLDPLELNRLVRELVEAGEADFAGLPEEHADWLVRRDDHQLMTLAVPLWTGEVAPTVAFVESLRSGLAMAFDGHWIVEPYTKNSGPFWDWYARQTHWSARHEGPRGVRPWVELTEGRRDGKATVELAVRAFTVEHRLANAEHPERLWFEPLGGDCVDGAGVAWCYSEGLTFDGPFVDGVAHGTGRHLYPEGKEHAGVVYEEGRMRYMGNVPPPPPPVRVVSAVRDDYVLRLSTYTGPSTWQDDWLGVLSPGDVPRPGSFLDFDPAYVDIPAYRTCGTCGGDGWIDTKTWVDQYEVTPTYTNTSLWMQGYDAVETYKGSGYQYSSEECWNCYGTGSAAY